MPEWHERVRRSGASGYSWIRHFSAEAKGTVDRNPTTPTGDQIKQDRGPGKMGRPGVRIDENFDDSRHPEQDEGRQARRQSQHEEDGNEGLDACRDMRSDLRGNQW